MTKPSNRTIPKTQHSANDKAVRAAYFENAEKIGAMLDQIGKRLKTHRARFDAALNAGRTDWGYPGDLGHVPTLLTEITEFLGKE
jgi:hypothetical protein